MHVSLKKMAKQTKLKYEGPSDTEFELLICEWSGVLFSGKAYIFLLGIHYQPVM